MKMRKLVSEKVDLAKAVVRAKYRQFRDKKAGAFGVVEVILILVIIAILIVSFKGTMTTIYNGADTAVTSKMSSIYN